LKRQFKIIIVSSESSLSLTYRTTKWRLCMSFPFDQLHPIKYQELTLNRVFQTRGFSQNRMKKRLLCACMKWFAGS